MNHARRHRTAALSALLVCGAACSGTLVAVAETGRVSQAPAAELTSDGDFEGTWARVEPSQQQALLIRRSDNGRRWELRLRWSTDKGFRIDTEWQERHEFVFRGHAGFIELEVDHEQSGEDRIVARWLREQDGRRGSHLVESGTLELYRTGLDGRFLVWRQDDLERRVTVAEPISQAEADTAPATARVVYNFNKQSDRMLEWDAIYW